MYGYSMYRCSIIERGDQDVQRMRTVKRVDASSYGDALLCDLYQDLYAVGAVASDISAMSDDLHARYGRPVGDGVELNIRPGENELIETAAGRFGVRVEYLGVSTPSARG